MCLKNWYHKPGVTWATQTTFQLLGVISFVRLLKNYGIWNKKRIGLWSFIIRLNETICVHPASDFWKKLSGPISPFFKIYGTGFKYCIHLRPKYEIISSQWIDLQISFHSEIEYINNGKDRHIRGPTGCLFRRWKFFHVLSELIKLVCICRLVHNGW